MRSIAFNYIYYSTILLLVKESNLPLSKELHHMGTPIYNVHFYDIISLNLIPN